MRSPYKPTAFIHQLNIESNTILIWCVSFVLLCIFSCAFRKCFRCVTCEKIFYLREKRRNMISMFHLPQLFSSDPSPQSFSPLQKRPRSIQLPSPQAKNPSWHRGSSVYSSGFTLRSLFFNLQFFTASFQSQVCFSMSKNRPAGQRIACKPWNDTIKCIWLPHLYSLSGFQN